MIVFAITVAAGAVIFLTAAAATRWLRYSRPVNWVRRNVNAWRGGLHAAPRRSKGDPFDWEDTARRRSADPHATREVLCHSALHSHRRAVPLPMTPYLDVTQERLSKAALRPLEGWDEVAGGELVTWQAPLARQNVWQPREQPRYWPDWIEQLRTCDPQYASVVGQVQLQEFRYDLDRRFPASWKPVAA